MTVIEAHSLIVKEGEAKFLPTSYRLDLTKHDLEQLKLSFPDDICGRFLWILKEVGTNMWTETNHKNSSAEIRSTVMSQLKWFGLSEAYYFDGEKLISVSFDDVKQIPGKFWK